MTTPAPLAPVVETPYLEECIGREMPLRDRLEARRELASLKAALRAGRDREARMLSAINWALGITADGEMPPRAEGQGAYYWRPELMRRAGLEYDGARFVAALTPPRPEQT